MSLNPKDFCVGGVDSLVGFSGGLIDGVSIGGGVVSGIMGGGVVGGVVNGMIGGVVSGGGIVVVCGVSRNPGVIDGLLDVLMFSIVHVSP
jgi:hypothetical protein